MVINTKRSIKVGLAVTGLILGLATFNYNINKKLNEGIQFTPIGVYDANKDGKIDYLVATPLNKYSPFFGAKLNQSQLSYYDGENVTRTPTGEYLTHETATPIFGTNFETYNNYPIFVVDLGVNKKGLHSLKIVQITEDFPVTIDKIVETK
ncbi:MAG: hypothetical protein WC758_04990 [Candidatus Woesearchaeota archaeon]